MVSKEKPTENSPLARMSGGTLPFKTQSLLRSYSPRGLLCQVNLRSSYAHGMLATGRNWLLVTFWSTVCALVQSDVVHADSVHFRYLISVWSRGWRCFHLHRLCLCRHVLGHRKNWISTRRSSRSRSPRLSSASTSRRSLGAGRLCSSRSLLQPEEWHVTEYIFTGFLNYVNAPGPCWGSRWLAMAVCACLARRARSAWQVPSSLYSTVNGAPGHN